VVAALVLCAAGVGKLRSPDPAWRALAVLGTGVPRWLVRILALGELALGASFAIHPTRAGGVAAGALFALFAAVGVLLARRNASCGCFGGDGAPASAMQALLSAALAVSSILAATAGGHGTIWLLRHGGYGGVVLIGCGACAYAIVLAYTRLPQAWRAWSGA
jgi:hypothetical protein